MVAKPSTAKAKAAKARRFRLNLARISRDTVLFGGGMLGIIHETLISKIDRPNLLLLFAAMVGLPAFLRADERRGKSNDDA